VNNEFNDHVLCHMAGVIAKYEATKSINHAGEKGSAREAMIAAAIEPWFGPSVANGSGFVIDALGQKSLQCDNVFYWPDLQPRLSLGHEIRGPGLFPVEGVAAVVEVKSTLTTTELSGAINNLEKTNCLQALSTAQQDDSGYKKAHYQISHCTSIVAFNSVVSYDTLISSLKDHSSWDLVCVLGCKGGVFANSRNGDLLELLPSETSDVRKLSTYSILLRDHIQNARTYRTASDAVENDASIREARL